jgi:hypothetical protein
VKSTPVPPSPPRDPDDLRRFAALVDWRAAARDKERYWCDWKKRHAPAEALRLADGLREQVVAQKPGWPGEDERREDHASHLRVEEALQRFDAWRRAAPH